MSVSKYFQEDMYLKSVLPDYHVRGIQVEIANIIEKSFENFSNAVMEAPTGSGKTMAYLVPVFDGNGKIIISTKTKQLMNQLLYKDIPSVQRIIGKEKSVRALKGRKNYFCPQRFFRLVLPRATYYLDAMEWYEENIKYGMIIEAPWGKLDGEVCNLMTADRFQCGASKCPYFEECAFYTQKREANNADVIVTNHFMLLSDMAMKSKNSFGSIFEFRDHIIFDEAHSLPDIFAQYAGVEFSLSSLMIFFYENRDVISISDINRIHNAYTKFIRGLRDSKYYYSVYQKDIANIMSIAEEIIKSVDNDDIQDEFKKYAALFKEMDSDREGARIIEKTSQKNNVIVTVKFIPFESGADFAAGLKESALSSVFVSATLSSDGNFDYFLEEIGLSDKCETCIMPRVFDFTAQGRLFIPESNLLADKDRLYADFVSAMSGSALIICNSIERMRKIEEILRTSVSDKAVYVQSDINIGELDFGGEDMVLIGSAALREGIDISGGSFKAVILDQLPFEYHKDLFLESKADKIKTGGGNAFTGFFLPRAVLYFKQAIGRLIRHEKDFGVWALFDDRILTKSYGKYFLDVINNVTMIRSIEEALAFIKGDKHG